LAWQRDELIHQDPWSEAGRLACLIDAVEYRKGAEAAPTFAMDCATRAVDEGRTWAAIWAAEALCDRVTDAPVSEESRALLERAALLFLRPRRVGCWGPTDLQRPVCAPVARALLDRLLGTFPDGTARTAFCRSFASRHGLMDQPLVAQALRDIIDREGAEALTDDELNLYVTCSGDAPGDIALLEARVNAEGPLACDLRFWQALVSLYCEQKQYEKLARTADGLAALATDREGCAQLMLACARSLGAAQLGNEALEVIRELTRTLPETTAAQAARELRAELGRGD